MGPWSRCVCGVGGLLAMRMRVGSGTLVQVCVGGGAAGHEDEGR